MNNQDSDQSDSEQTEPPKSVRMVASSNTLHSNDNSILRNNHSINKRTISTIVDSETEDEDETMSILEAEEQADNMTAMLDRNSAQHNKLEETTKRLVWEWIARLIKYLIVSALIMAPGTTCKVLEIKGCELYETALIRYCIFLTIVVLGYYIAKLSVFILMLVIKRVPVVGKQYLFFISNLSFPLQLVIETVIIQAGWAAVFTGQKVFYTDQASTFGSLVSCLLITAICLLVKAIVLRFIAISFHRSSYYGRIKNALLSELVVTRLMQTTDGKKQGKSFYTNVKSYVRNEANELAKSLKSKQQDQLLTSTLPITEEELFDRKPFTNVKLAAYVEFLKRTSFSFKSGMFKQYVLQAALESNVLDEYVDLNNIADYETLLERLPHVQITKVLAKLLYKKLENKGKVTMGDFLGIMSQDLSQRAFNMFDGAWNNSLTEKNFYTTLLHFARERTALRTALNDAESAVDKLNGAISGVLGLILFVVYFIVFGSSPVAVLTTVSSFLLASAFAIGSSAKQLLESIIFIFVTHCFDIGDRITIDKINYTVAKMSLLTCQFRRFDNALITYSNSVLSQLPIINLRRSPDQIDIVELQVAFHTPTQVLRQLESAIASYLERHSGHYYPKFEVEYKELENTNLLLIRIWVQHRANFQNRKRYRERRGRIVLKLKRICHVLGIEYQLPDQRVNFVSEQSGPTLPPPLVQ